ncbi:MAG: hypothetical protein HYX67_17185 [Candidatus Melainabacteria bacterium]|nr:hypothetical protein [Candidatus Melainabacteria bacterium]
MRTQNLVALVLFLMAAVQQAQADIAPGPSPPPPDQSLPVVLAGVCLSLAIVFFGLWFVNYKKAAKAKLKTDGTVGVTSMNDLNQLSNRR